MRRGDCTDKGMELRYLKLVQGRHFRVKGKERIR